MWNKPNPLHADWESSRLWQKNFLERSTSGLTLNGNGINFSECQDFVKSVMNFHVAEVKTFRIQTFVQLLTKSETSMPCLNGPAVHPLLAKFNQFPTLSRPSFKIYFNIVFLSTPASPKWPSSSLLPTMILCSIPIYFACALLQSCISYVFVIWLPSTAIS
jgi:hypothetical protein